MSQGRPGAGQGNRGITDLLVLERHQLRGPRGAGALIHLGVQPRVLPSRVGIQDCVDPTKDAENGHRDLIVRPELRADVVDPVEAASHLVMFVGHEVVLRQRVSWRFGHGSVLRLCAQGTGVLPALCPVESAVDRAVRPVKASANGPVSQDWATLGARSASMS